MPFYNITTFELIEDVLFKTESIKQNLGKNLHADIFTVCDNDILKQLKFSYSTEDEFNRLVHSNNIELAVFHLNIRSLNKNHSGLIQLLQLYNLEFDVLILSEIWNYNLEFYDNILENYNFYYQAPITSKIGGVDIFVKKIVRVL